MFFNATEARSPQGRGPKKQPAIGCRRKTSPGCQRVRPATRGCVRRPRLRAAQLDSAAIGDEEPQIEAMLASRINIEPLRHERKTGERVKRPTRSGDKDDRASASLAWGPGRRNAVAILVASNCNACHFAAFFRAMAAGFGATLAMVVMVFLTLRAAGIADFRADTAQIGCERRSSAHKGRRAPANFGTITIKTDAFRHLLHTWLAQTSIRAMLTRLSTARTGFNT